MICAALRPTYTSWRVNTSHRIIPKAYTSLCFEKCAWQITCVVDSSCGRCIYWAKVNLCTQE